MRKRIARIKFNFFSEYFSHRGYGDSHNTFDQTFFKFCDRAKNIVISFNKRETYKKIKEPQGRKNSGSKHNTENIILGCESARKN